MLALDPDRPWLAWRVIDGELIFLDIAADRYFRLPDERNRSFRAEIERSGRCSWRQPPELPRPRHWVPPALTSPAIAHGSFHLAETARALWLQRRVERRMAVAGFGAGLAATAQLLAAGRNRSRAEPAQAARVIRAFEQARVLRSAATRCLARSIALAVRLAACGAPARVVIGVKLAPFAAHCWAQCGDAVASDNCDEVQCYTPLLVL